MTEAQIRKIVREEVAAALDSQARRVQGISSFERYLEVVLQAARER
jgi:hypothetical protein